MCKLDHSHDSVGAKFFVCFNIKTYFFILFYIFTFQNNPHQIIYFTLYYIKYQIFLIFLIVYLFLHTISIIHYFLSTSGFVKQE